MLFTANFRTMQRVRQKLAPCILLTTIFMLSACGMFFSAKTTQQRIASLPIQHTQLHEEVIIRWNSYMVPYVFAKNNHDLAYTLGLLQGHMRGGLVQFFKRIAYGRLSEIAGPIATDVDHLLHLIDFPRAANDVLAAMPKDTQDWLYAFVAGFNHAMRSGEKQPDSGLLNVENELLRPQDIIAMGRVAGADVNWGKYMSLLQTRSQNPTDWPRFFADALAQGYSIPKQPNAQAFAIELLHGISRSGSNAVAVAPSRSASGGALLISDPHLGFFLPNPWLLVGIQSPDMHLVGAMAPGLPFIAFGRNKNLAWGGTNMRSASSDLFRVSSKHNITSQEISIHNRFWFPKKHTIRNSTYGPIVSDHPFFPALENETIALKWMGHTASDEISAFLQLHRATQVQQVAQAMHNAGVSGQNIIAVDDQGNIGHILAVHLPQRTFVTPPDLVLDPTTQDWIGYDTSTTLQTYINPHEGYIGSANDQPTWLATKLGYFMSVPDRPVRIAEIMQQKKIWDITAAKQLQSDTVSPYARTLARTIYTQLHALPLSATHVAFIDHFAQWDGDYAQQSYAPVAFEITLYYLLKTVYAHRIEDDELPSYIENYAWLVEKFPHDLEKTIRDTFTQANTKNNRIYQALDKAQKQAKKIQNWGNMHQLVVAPPYARIPFIGKIFQRHVFPIGGSRQTIMKTNHDVVHTKHQSRYGSQSRHISDMSNLDANYFVLLGGQDGWPQSENYADQIPMWHNNTYIQLPLTQTAIEKEFTRWITILQPSTNN